jgi:hypothetical protein
MNVQVCLRWALSGALASTSACAVPREGYLRQDMALGELLLARTPRGLAFVRQDADGRRALDLEHLAAAVDCVPDARAELDAVRSLQTTGTVMKWIGWAAFLSGTALVVASVVKGDHRYIPLGASVAGSGGALTETPRYLAPYVFQNAMDAMNAYNDQFRSTAACGGRPPPPAAAPGEEPGPGALPKPGDPGPGGPRF